MVCSSGNTHIVGRHFAPERNSPAESLGLHRNGQNFFFHFRHVRCQVHIPPDTGLAVIVIGDCRSLSLVLDERIGRRIQGCKISIIDGYSKCP